MTAVYPNFGLPEPIAHSMTPIVAATKKSIKVSNPASASRAVEIDFSAPPKEFLFFNRYRLETSGEFIQLQFGFADASGTVVSVFHGMIWRLDLDVQLKDFKSYIEKIGAPNVTASKDMPFVAGGVSKTPVAINRLDCASRGGWGEIAVRQFSHRAVMDRKQPESEPNVVTGITHGVYVSDTETHKRLIYDLIVSGGSQP